MQTPSSWFTLEQEGSRLFLRRPDATLRELFGAFRNGSVMLDVFEHSLAEAPFAAFFWETPPVTRGTTARPLELVLVDAPALASMRPEPEPFSRYFRGDHAGDGAVTFPNLGGDALLVAPCPGDAPEQAYAHLAAFVRHAPRRERRALWRAVAAAIDETLRDEPLWVSTSGLGVGWLHVRLDSQPKYYQHEPYRQAGG